MGKDREWDDLLEGGASLQCLNFAVDLGRNYFAALFHSKQGDNCTDFVMQRGVGWRGGGCNLLFVFSECECEVFCKTDVHPLVKMVNWRVPLFHYVAVNLHNELNCLVDVISMSRTPLSFSMAYGNLMAITLLATDQNSFCLSCKILKFAGWVFSPFSITPSLWGPRLRTKIRLSSVALLLNHIREKSWKCNIRPTIYVYHPW